MYADCHHELPTEADFNSTIFESKLLACPCITITTTDCMN